MSMKKRYYTVNGEIIGEQTTGQERIDYLTDALGSVTTTLDQSQKVVNTYAYKPSGAELSKTGTASDPAYLWAGAAGFRQTGCKFAEVSVQARHYSPLLGQMIHSHKRPAPFISGRRYPIPRISTDTSILPPKKIPMLGIDETPNWALWFEVGDFVMKQLLSNVYECPEPISDWSTATFQQCNYTLWKCLPQPVWGPEENRCRARRRFCEGACFKTFKIDKVCKFLYAGRCIVERDKTCAGREYRTNCISDIIPCLCDQRGWWEHNSTLDRCRDCREL
jgi:hypothetical protein